MTALSLLTCTSIFLLFVPRKYNSLALAGSPAKLRGRQWWEDEKKGRGQRRAGGNLDQRYLAKRIYTIGMPIGNNISDNI